MIKWEYMEPEDPYYLQPPKPFSCLDGWTSHVVTVDINEGQASVSLNRKVCNLCSDGLADLEPEYLQAEFKATITSQVERTYDDAWVWFDLTPTCDEVERLRSLLADLLNDCENWGCAPHDRYREALKGVIS